MTEGHASLDVSLLSVARALGVALPDLQGARLRLAVAVVEAQGRGVVRGGAREEEGLCVGGGRG